VGGKEKAQGGYAGDLFGEREGKKGGVASYFPTPGRRELGVELETFCLSYYKKKGERENLLTSISRKGKGRTAMKREGEKGRESHTDHFNLLASGEEEEKGERRRDRALPPLQSSEPREGKKEKRAF